MELVTRKLLLNLNKVRSPLTLRQLSLALAEKALDDDEFVKNCTFVNGKQKERFIDMLTENKLHLFDSQANFVLIEVPGNVIRHRKNCCNKGLLFEVERLSEHRDM